MAISAGGSGDTPMSDINTTPLVDVMLVMLIIFIITVPAVVQNVKLKLPNVRNEVTETKPENVSLSIRREDDGNCGVYRGQLRINHDDLLKFATDKMKADVERLKAAGPINPDDIPEVHIRGDVDAPYKCIGAAIFTMQEAGFIKVGFISNPPPKDQPAS